jgi:hypothetical protein
MNNVALVTYLNDHLGGARAALDLIEHLNGRSEGDAAMREFLSRLHADVSEDREALVDVIHRVGGSPDPLRVASGWIAEKLTRLKLALDDPGDGGLERLQALEVVLLGIAGKGALWRALANIAAAAPSLRGVDLSRLQQRAEEQFARVERQRLAAVQRSLTPVQAA